MDGESEPEKASRLAPWDMLSRVIIAVCTLMACEAVYLGIYYLFRAREGRLPKYAMVSWVNHIRGRPEIELLFFLWGAWTAHGFDQEYKFDTVGHYRYYLYWMTSAPFLSDILEDHIWAWPTAAQVSLFKRSEEITKIGTFKAAFASHLLAIGGSPIDLPFGWSKPPSDYWYREAFREINVAAGLTLTWWYCYNNDPSLRFWTIVFEPIALMTIYVAAANILSCIFRPDENFESYKILPNSLRYRLNVGKTAVMRAFLSAQELVSHVEDNWRGRYRSTKRNCEKFRTLRVLFSILEALFRWIVGMEKGELENLADFKYGKIRQNQIRLVRIHKRTLFRPPCCKLVTVVADSATNYVACSYVWGQESRHREIVLNGRRFLLTDSAYQVIRRKQTFFGESTIWIDSICINQNDGKEKAAQISKMKGIFRNAEQVEAYVDPGKKSSTIKFFMEQLKGEAKHEQPAAGVFSPSAYHIRELAVFLCRPWFSRIWILQEAAVARKLTVTNGTDVFDWEQLITAVKYFKERPKLLSRLRTEIFQENLRSVDAQSRPLDMNAIRRGVLLHDHSPLVELLLASGQRKFSEPHDRVFALLGMAPPEATETIGIDYNISIRELFTRTMKYLLNCDKDKTGGLQLLANAGVRRETDDMDRLPSWVSSWDGPFQDALSKNKPKALWSAAGFVSRRIGSVCFQNYTMKCCTKKIGNINALFGGPIPNEPLKYLNDDATAPTNFGMERGAVRSAFNDAAEYFVQFTTEHDSFPEFVETFYLSPIPALALTEQGKLTFKLITSLFKGNSKSLLDLLPGDIKVNILKMFQRSMEGATTLMTCLLPPVIERKEAKGERATFRNLAGRRFAATAKTHVSLVPEATLETDEVHLIAGAVTPFVLRPLVAQTAKEGEGQRRFQIVGACYVCGAMAGELAEDSEKDPEELKWQDVLIE